MNPYNAAFMKKTCGLFILESGLLSMKNNAIGNQVL